MIASPELVLFAIQAGLRLYGAARKAYVDGTRDRSLVLPLPRAPGVGFDSAYMWFTDTPQGQDIAQRHTRIQKLLTASPQSDDEKSELVDLYLAFHGDAATEAGRGQFSREELGALLTIRQWAKGEPGASPSALQQTAGALIEVAVDYFAQVPGAISAKRPEGRALLAFLREIDRIKFAEMPAPSVAGNLLVAVLDSVSANPGLISGGQNEKLFIQNTTRAMAAAANEHLKDASSERQDEAVVWLQILSGAILKGGAETVLANPVRFLGVKPGAETAVVAEVGRTIADLLIGPQGADFTRLLSAHGVDKLVKSSLDAVARNPDILRLHHQGLKNILIELARTVSGFQKRLSPDLLPRIAPLVLQKTAENLDLVWGKDSSDPKQHLLITAARSLLTEIARAPANDHQWQPDFTAAQVLEVAETVFDEVIDNPAWLVKEAGEANDTLGAAIAAILASLRKLDGPKLSLATGVAVLKSGLLAVSRRASFLRKTGDGPNAGRAITVALDAIFQAMSGGSATSEGQWQLARNSTITAVVGLVLGQLARRGVETRHLQALREALQGLLQPDGTLDLEAFGKQLADKLDRAV